MGSLRASAEYTGLRTALGAWGRTTNKQEKHTICQTQMLWETQKRDGEEWPF